MRYERGIVWSESWYRLMKTDSGVSDRKSQWLLLRERLVSVCARRQSEARKGEARGGEESARRRRGDALVGRLRLRDAELRLRLGCMDEVNEFDSVGHKEDRYVL